METATKRVSIGRILVIALVGGALCYLVYISPAFFSVKDGEPELPRLNVGGTSNIFILLENRWRRAYKLEKGVEIKYDSTGSTHGINQMIDKKIAVAFTHAPLSEEQRKQAIAKGGEVVQIPVVLCAVIPAYNVKELNDKPPLRFSGQALADIFLGKIERWNHPILQELNKDITLPDKKIIVVHREDSSGTTLIFAEYLQAASIAWHKSMGDPKSELNWPVGVGKARNDGVAREVIATDGAIGYVDLLHGLLGQLSYGAVENKDGGAFIHAKAKYMTAAANAVPPENVEDLTFSIICRPGKDSYPISGVIWAVCFKNQPSDQHQQVADFLRWIIGKGQTFAENMSFAPLPDNFVTQAQRKIEQIGR